MEKYKVWIAMERITENENGDEDEYEELDLPFGSAGVFQKEEAAMKYAETLQTIAEDVFKANKLNRALIRLLDCPALNLDDLEPEDNKAINIATDAIIDAGRLLGSL